MNKRYLSAAFGMLVMAMQPGFPTSTHADESTRPRLALVADDLGNLAADSEGAFSVQRVEIPAPPVPGECKPRYMVGPGMGLALGPNTMVLGMFTAAAGQVGVALNSPKTSRDRALNAGGALLFAAGTATFLYSIGKLVKNRRTRKQKCSPE